MNHVSPRIRSILSASWTCRCLVASSLLFYSVTLRVHAVEPLPPADLRVEQAIGAHIGFLADDLLEGRGTATAGHELAARYVSAQFGQFGLQPGGDSNSWLQTVPLLESQLVPDSASLELYAAGETNVLEYNLDFLAAPHFTETNVAVRAPLVFAGFGVQAKELNYDDFAGLDLRGKIAVVLSKAPPRFPTTALAHHAHLREKLKQLVARGAVGVITIPTPKDLEEAPWPRRVNQSRFPSMRWLTPEGLPADFLPQSKASLTMSPRGIGKIFRHSPKAVEDILAAAARSEPQAFPLNLEAAIRTRSQHRRLASPNVIGVLPGSDPVLRGQSVVLSAHLDHQGRGPVIRGDAIYNGAYDNAIGTAMMLEVARLLGNSTAGPRRTVVFAAVTGEEKGLVGSDYLAGHLTPKMGRVVANLNLDMVLVTAPTRSYTILGVEHSTLRAPVEEAARQFNIDLQPDPQPERVTFIRSDQYSFIRRGVPAIFPKIFSPPKSQAAAVGISPETFLKEHYHQPSDDLSLPRDAESTVRFVRFMTEIARQVADADEPPRWNAGDFFGQTFGGER